MTVQTADKNIAMILLCTDQVYIQKQSKTVLYKYVGGLYCERRCYYGLWT